MNVTQVLYSVELQKESQVFFSCVELPLRLVWFPLVQFSGTGCRLAGRYGERDAVGAREGRN
jgi:hypothetical protein